MGKNALNQVEDMVGTTECPKVNTSSQADAMSSNVPEGYDRRVAEIVKKLSFLQPQIQAKG